MSKTTELGHQAIDSASIKVLRDAKIIPPDMPVEQIRVFARVCNEKGLSPFTGTIVAVGYWNTRERKNDFSYITTIDGYRQLAADTGELVGVSEPMFNYKSDGSFMTLAEVKQTNQMPVSCRVIVRRKKGNHVGEFVGEVLFKEYCRYKKDGTRSQKWATMPYHMIRKCAAALAYKDGFGEKLQGLHIHEEMAAFEDMNTGITQEENKPFETERSKFLSKLKKEINNRKKYDTVAALRAYYASNPDWRNDELITTMFKEASAKLEE